MSESAYEWGDENFCAPDARHLYETEPRRLTEVGYPVELEDLPESFCSVCLLWFTGPHPGGLDHQPPAESKEPNDRTD